jgi:hypothetical protein
MAGGDGLNLLEMEMLKRAISMLRKVFSILMRGQMLSRPRPISLYRW